MKPSERRKQMKEEMQQRLQESYNSKDSSGKYKSIFLKEMIGSTEMWKCSEDEHFLNVIPYIAGPKNPTVKPGKLAYSLDIYVHRKVGVNEDSYICLSRTFNQKCPVCDEQNELRKQEDYDEKYVKSLNPTRRVIYNIECLDSDKEAKKGIQLFEVSHWLFEKELAELAKKPKGGGFVLFSDPDDGKTICFRKKGTGPTNTEYKAFQFIDREEPISDDLLDSALCLDELIHIPTYDEVKNAFYGTEADEMSDNEKEERKAESESQTRRPARPAKFVCPGASPEDFGNLKECEECPVIKECEAAFEELEAENLANEKAAAELEQSAKEAEKEEVKPAAVVRRRAAASTPDTPTSEEKKEETAAAPAESRRVRRRPGA